MAPLYSKSSAGTGRSAAIRDLSIGGLGQSPIHEPSPSFAHVLANWTICGLFAFGILVLMFHAWEVGGIGPVAQVVGVLLVLAAGGLAWLFGGRPVAPAPVELCLLAMGFLSLFRLSFNNNISPDTVRTSFSVALILLFAVAGNAALIRRISIERLLNVSATALALATLPILAFESKGIIGALTAGDERWAWLFSPFDLHHSLTSIIFSLGIMLSIYRIIAGNLWIKAAFSAALIAQLTIVLATGGRTGVLACSTSLALVFVFRMRSAPPIVWLGVLLVAVGGLLFSGEMVSFLSTMMELQSEYRGFGTGATGRTEIWNEGIELILADPVRLLFGSGLRAPTVEDVGFNPENSYIAITLESGGIMLMWFVVSLLATIVRLHYQATDPGKDKILILYGLLPILQFALIVGLFNRQMLSVGNPASMIFLVVFAGAWVYVSGPRPEAIGSGRQTAEVADSAAERRRRKAHDQPLTSSLDPTQFSPAMLRRRRAADAEAV